jgi:hypothetical protein
MQCYRSKLWAYPFVPSMNNSMRVEGTNLRSMVGQFPFRDNTDILARTLLNPSESDFLFTEGVDHGLSSSFLKAAAQQQIQNLGILITQQKLRMLEKHCAMLLSQPSQSMAAHIIQDQQRIHPTVHFQRLVESQSSTIQSQPHDEKLSHRDFNDLRHFEVRREQWKSKESVRTLSNSQNNRLPPTTHRKKRIVSGKWEYQYQNLVEYKAEHGDCIVPRGYLTNPKLASWVAEQRKQYKLFHRNQDTSMTQDRIFLLNEIGFVWNAQEAAWEKKLNALASFHKKYRTWKVPIDHPTYQKLALWVKEQRRHRSLKKQGKSSHMTVERIRRLEEIGFRFDRNIVTHSPEAGKVSCRI